MRTVQQCWTNIDNSDSPMLERIHSPICGTALFLLLVLSATVTLSAQVPTGVSPSPPMAKPIPHGGMATAGAQKAEFDTDHRPITAGGLVKTGPIIFMNVAAQAGLATWHNTTGTPSKRYIAEAKGSGVALLDYDNDGWLDIYLVNGSTYEALEGKAIPPHAALFHNNHDGTFTNVAEKAGVTNDRWGLGVAIGDYDNDGWPDICVTNFGKNRLYHNNHNGTFTDVAEKAGVALGIWSDGGTGDYTGATFGDYDGDGRLDLFIAGYVHFNPRHPPAADPNSVDQHYCQFRGVEVMCGPRGLRGEHDHLFHNNGDGTFTDVSEKLGVSDPNAYYGLAAIFLDVNGDGKQDLVVANDSTPNYLYINKGDGTFEDDSYASGYALNQDGRELSNMGIAAGDYENNGHMSLANTAFSDDWNVLFRNDDGKANFTDVSYKAGVAEPTIPFVGFGDGFLDYDNDGWKDLMYVNGHVYPDVDKHPDWGTTYAQRVLLFHNSKNGKFDLVPAVEGTGLATLMVGRGAAFGDLFNDGKIDVVINSMDQAPVLLRNVNPDEHHWVELKLIGNGKTPRDAVGTTVYLMAAGLRQRGDVLSGGSYISSNDQRLHFGIVDATAVDMVEIHWQNGPVEKVKLPRVDRIFTIEEGKGVTGEMCVGCAVRKIK